MKATLTLPQPKGLSEWLLVSSVFLLPVATQFVPLLLTCFVAAGIWECGLPQRFRVSLSVLLSGPLFWLMCALGLLWAGAGAQASDPETKLSLLALPIAGWWMHHTGKGSVALFFRFLRLGCWLAFGVLITQALYRYNLSHNPLEFAYQQFSPRLHPSYLSLYVLVVLGMDAWLNPLAQPVRVRLFHAFSLTLFLFFLSSKAALATWMLMVLLFGISTLLKGRNKPRWWLGFMVLLIASAQVLMRIPGIKERFQEFSESTAWKGDFSPGSTGMRLAIWKEGWQLAQEAPFWGYGTGAGKARLVERYGEKGWAEMAERKLNAHNQFLQVFLNTGYPGLLLLLLMLGNLGRRHFALNRIWGTVFVLVLVLNLMVECMLETQAGTMFFGLLLSLFPAEKQAPQTPIAPETV
jgi:O-antigen ligase